MARTRRQASQAAQSPGAHQGTAPLPKPAARSKHDITEKPTDIEDVKRELGVQEDLKPPAGPIQRIAEFINYILLRISISIGSLLLTPFERAIYHSAVLIIIVLVALGILHQARFYAHASMVLTHSLMQDGWQATYERFVLGKQS